MPASFVCPVLESIQVPEVVQSPGHVRQVCSRVLLYQLLAQFQSPLEVPASRVHPLLLCIQISDVSLRYRRIGLHEQNTERVMRERIFRDRERVRPQVVIAIPITHLAMSDAAQCYQRTQCRNCPPNSANFFRLRQIGKTPGRSL